MTKSSIESINLEKRVIIGHEDHYFEVLGSDHLEGKGCPCLSKPNKSPVFVIALDPVAKGYSVSRDCPFKDVKEVRKFLGKYLPVKGQTLSYLYIA